MSQLTFQDVLKILQLVASGVDLDVECEGTRVKVRRRAASLSGAVPIAAPSPAPAIAAEPAPVPAPAPRADVDLGGGMAVTPPMAGTFYAAPAPGAAPFVTIGQVVRAGDQLGVVEVMKLFTAIHAPCDGTVRVILVGNEEFVQHDQILMVIDPEGWP